MNTNRLQLMVTMLKEVEAGTWKASPTRLKEIYRTGMYNDNLHIEKDADFNSFANSPKEFNLATWFQENPHNDQNEESCGFTACAVGHAMLDTRFNRMGLKAVLMQGNWFSRTMIKPVYDDLMEFAAVEKFFGLEEDTAESLFMPSCYPEHLQDKALVIQVRRRIEKLLELGEDDYKETKLCSSDNIEMLVSPKGRIYKEYKNA